MSAERKRHNSIFSWLLCCSSPADDDVEDTPEPTPTSAGGTDSGSAVSATAPQRKQRGQVMSVGSHREAGSSHQKNLSRTFSAPEVTAPGPSKPIEQEPMFPDQGVVYEVLGLKYERGTLRTDTRSKGEAHWKTVEASAREARDKILTPHFLSPISEEDLPADATNNALDISQVQSLLKVSLVLADVLQLQGKVEDADDILSDTLGRLLDTALEQSSRISAEDMMARASQETTAISPPSNSEAASKTDKSLQLRLKAAAHHRMGSIKRSQGDLLSAESHLRASADILGKCAAAGDLTANGEKAATLALLATILIRVGKEDEAALVDREALALRAAADTESS